ncbi:MAG: outer membrane protein assembly factor BamD [Deltaproteobacteria bacterium]|nr:outer membrane protein assembly factor BamD [Deltaproteobacteria bacterium]
MRFWIFALFPVLLAAGCTTLQPEVKIPARLLYLEAQVLEDQGLYSEAITKYQQVVDQNLGARLGSFAYLKMGELKMRQEEWRDAETNFQLFLGANSNSHLTPFVLFRLLKAHHENSYTGLIFREREIDRDMNPNLRMITEFQRLYFLYPNSRYQQEARGYYRAARETLADHERLVADYYYRHGLYNAAASRYLYLLRNYPEYPGSLSVLERLIASYRHNQQPELAEEMQRIRNRLFGSADAGSPTPVLATREPSATHPQAAHTE